MEVTRTRIVILAALLIVLSISVSGKFRPKSEAVVRSERWLEDALPTEVDGLEMVVGRDNPRQSYRASEVSYRSLKPYGIVCRVFGTKRRAFDATVVASNSLDSFHDPEACFPLSGWTITGWRDVQCATKYRGQVPVRIITMSTPEGSRLGAFCYKGPVGMRATQSQFALSWVMSELRSRRAQEGAFYRFVQIKGSDSEIDLLAFISDFLDGAFVASKGLL